MELATAGGRLAAGIAVETDRQHSAGMFMQFLIVVTAKHSRVTGEFLHSHSFPRIPFKLVKHLGYFTAVSDHDSSSLSKCRPLLGRCRAFLH